MKRIVVVVMILVGVALPAHAEIRIQDLSKRDQEAVAAEAFACLISLSYSTGANEIARRAMDYTKNNGEQLPHLELMNDVLSAFEQNLGLTVVLCRGTTEETKASALQRVIRSLRMEILRLIVAKRAVP